MTAAERDAIRVLTEKLDSYHTAVEKHMTACESCRQTVENLKKDVWGPAGESLKNPGLKGRVESLEYSRGTLRTSLRLSWATLLVFVPAAIAGIWKAAKWLMGIL